MLDFHWKICHHLCNSYRAFDSAWWNKSLQCMHDHYDHAALVAELWSHTINASRWQVLTLNLCIWFPWPPLPQNVLVQRCEPVSLTVAYSCLQVHVSSVNRRWTAVSTCVIVSTKSLATPWTAAVGSGAALRRTTLATIIRHLGWDPAVRLVRMNQAWVIHENW